jgi:hypothetical protein
MPHTAAARTATRERDAGRYQRHRPEQILLYRIVERHYPASIAHLVHTIACRVGRLLERQGLLERDTENCYLAGEAVDEDPMNQLLGSSITYRVAVGPQQGRKVFTLQRLPARDADDQYCNNLL